MAGKPDLKPARREESQEFDPKGVAFLRQHGLKIVPEEKFVELVDKPYIVATDYTHFHLQYDKYSSISVGCIIDHERQTPRNSLTLLINILSAYVDNLDAAKKHSFIDVFHLENAEAMQVKLKSPGWENVFRLAQHEFPGTIIWPQKK